MILHSFVVQPSGCCLFTDFDSFKIGTDLNDPPRERKPHLRHTISVQTLSTVIQRQSDGQKGVGYRARVVGFTLIELLSVVAIVGVLGAIVTASVLNAQKRARQLQCMNNVRQLSAGVSLFVTEHGE